MPTDLGACYCIEHKGEFLFHVYAQSTERALYKARSLIAARPEILQELTARLNEGEN